ncbi:MAG: oxygen-dependent protoporphyrinogen oxidase [Myxococcota bacterium]
MAKIVIVGAGVSGLATAAFLDGEGHDITVLEAQDEAGGNVRSERIDGRVCDRAANGWLDNEPAMDRLITRLDLKDELLPASDRFSARYIFADGRLHAAPLSAPALATTKLLSPWAKLRILGEPFVGRAPPDADETIAEFVTRRLGAGFAERMVGPMVAGIYAARPDQIALRSAFPRMWEMEQEHGGLFRAAVRLRRGGAPRGRLTTLKEGSGQLTQTITDRLGERLQTGEPVAALERRREGWQVHTARGAVAADAVVLACPAWAQATMLRGLDAGLAETFASIPYSPVAVVVTAWPAGAWDRRPDGFGVLVAPGEDLGGLLGTLLTSCIFPSHAPSNELLMRSILGGAVYPEAVEMDDQQLLAQCRAALVRFFGQERAAPLMVKIFRHRRGIPQYAPGHMSRVRAVRAGESKHAGLFFTGNHLEGIGVKDCAREGERTAGAVLRWLA